MGGEWKISELADLTINFDGKRKPVRESDRRAGPYAYYGASGVVDVDGFLFDGDYLLIAEDDTLLPKLISGELRIADAEGFLETRP